MGNALSILVLLAVIFYILLKFYRIRDDLEGREEQENSGLKVTTETVVGTTEIPAVSERLKTAVPTATGLFPHEISLLGHLSNPRARKNITQAWLSRYPMRDPASVLERLVNLGFAKWDGKRARTTEKGLKEVEENEYVFFCETSNYINVWELNKLINNVGNCNPKRFKWRDLVWQRLNERKVAAVRSLKFHETSSLEREIGYFLRAEGRNEGALRCFVRSAFIEANDLKGMPLDQKDEELLNFWLKTQASTHGPFTPLVGCSILPPYAIEPIIGVVREMELTIEKLREITLDECLRLKRSNYPEVFFTTEELTEILCYSVFEDADKLKAIYTVADERLQRKAESLGS